MKKVKINGGYWDPPEDNTIHYYGNFDLTLKFLDVDNFYDIDILKEKWDTGTYDEMGLITYQCYDDTEPIIDDILWYLEDCGYNENDIYRVYGDFDYEIEYNDYPRIEDWELCHNGYDELNVKFEKLN